MTPPNLLHDPSGGRELYVENQCLTHHVEGALSAAQVMLKKELTQKSKLLRSSSRAIAKYVFGFEIFANSSQPVSKDILNRLNISVAAAEFANFINVLNEIQRKDKLICRKQSASIIRCLMFFNSLVQNDFPLYFIQTKYILLED